MHDDMAAYVRQHEPVSSQELAEHFLKFKSPVQAMAHAAIKGILASDKRCCFGDDGMWHSARQEPGSQAALPLSDMRVIAIFLLWSPGGRGRSVGVRPLHVSAWTVEDSPDLVYDAWLEDPDGLPQDEQEVLRSVRDRPFHNRPPEEPLAAELLSICENRIPVFMTYRDLSFFFESIVPSESRAVDDALVVSTLMTCGHVPVPRPLSIDACYEAVFGTTPSLSYAYKYGECLALCVRELLSRLQAAGIASMADLESSEKDELATFDFSQKAFGLQDIYGAPALPGVYGFKTKTNDFLYIGKASNLRRRLMTYFRPTDESPEKIAAIRAESHGLITSVCGSELESLIYEYRLIRKHKPGLNTQIAINERKGDFRPIDDCVIMLPHAEAAAGKAMAFFFKKSQKILLRPFFSDFRDAAALIVDLNGFFFGAPPKPDPQDFPEQEIATRWVKQYQDKLPIVLISRVANAKEACDSMRGVWKDFCEKINQAP
jgi:GIY-YIG catalytic domain